jgi:hypothetical protein
VAFVSQSVQLVQNKKKGSRRRVSSAVFKVPTVTPKKYTGNRYRYSRRAEARLLAPTRGQAGLLLVGRMGILKKRFAHFACAFICTTESSCGVLFHNRLFTL